MNLIWIALAALALAAVVGRLVVAVQRDGYGERPPARPDAWRAGDLPSTPYRLPPF